MRLTQTLKDLARPLVFHRRFQAFGVGTPKSGTASLAGLAERAYRARHEPQSAKLLSRVLAFQGGQTDPDSLRRWLRARDRQLWLEIESAHLLSWLIEHLVTEFPKAKFVLTIRDCYTWLDSEINQQLAPGGGKGPFATASELRYGESHAAYRSERELFEPLGLYPIPACLAYWPAHNRRVLETVPSERLLVVRTHEIEDSLDPIADFFEIPPATLQVDGARVNVRTATTLDLREAVPHDHVDRQARQYCGALMEAFFPEISGVIDAFERWPSSP